MVSGMEYDGGSARNVFRSGDFLPFLLEEINFHKGKGNIFKVIIFNC